MSSFLSSLNLGKESETHRLKVENKALCEEILQCQADKDFVWSLWKRLQVSNPDVTQAVGLIVQREREKTEAKDRKILEILTAKDKKIGELQQLISDQSEEIKDIITKKLEFEERAFKLERERAELQQKLSELNPKIREYASREAIRDLDKQNLDLKKELQRKNEENERLRYEKQDWQSMGDGYKQKVKYDDMKKLLKKYENQLTSQQQDLQVKSTELERVRSELHDLWHTHQQTTEHATQQADLIRQLQFLQQDTQKMMQNTETAHSIEATSLQTENRSLKSSYHDMARQIQLQTKTIEDLQSHLTELQRQLEDRASEGEDITLYKTVDSLQRDVAILMGSHMSKRSRSLSPSIMTASEPTVTRSGRRSRLHSKVKQRSKSVGDPEDGDLKHSLEVALKKLSDTRLLLSFKTKELEEFKSCHGRRLDRVQSLQRSNQLLKKQISLMEEEIPGPKKKKKKRLQRADPRSLQREDSDTVWNELAYYRKQAKKLHAQNISLGEECDSLKVALTQAEATNHELKVNLDQEKEELQFLLDQEREKVRDSNAPSVHQEAELTRLSHLLDSYKRQTDRLRQQLDGASDQQRQLEADRQQMREEKRAMKAEVNTLRQQDSTYRINIADYKKEISRLQRELKRQKKKKVKSPKQYQQTLNRSIQEMSKVFDQFNKDDWQDMGDGGVTYSESSATETAGSLGEAIADHAHSSMQEHRDRQIGAENHHYRRMHNKPEKEVSYRSVALSPIPFSTSTSSTSTRSTSTVARVAKSSHVLSKKPSLTTATNSKLVSTLRQRISTLQTNLLSQKRAKEVALRSNAELKSSVKEMTEALTTANEKLHNQKLNVQRFASDLDRVRSEKEELEHKVDDYLMEESTNQHSEQEWANLNMRLKNASNELSKQLTQVKELKTETCHQQQRITQLLDKNKSLERDVAQKRLLVEEMKVKVKMVSETTQADAKTLEEVEARLTSATEMAQRYKTQIDSLKARLSVASKEKRDNEEKVFRLTDEIEKKGSVVGELQCKVRSLQSTVSEVEKTAKQQLTSLASQSETAIDMAQHKLLNAGGKLQEYTKFIKVLGHSLVTSLQQSRQFLTQQKQRRELDKKEGDAANSSQTKYHSLACNLLNLSQSDLEDILTTQDTETGKLLESQLLSEVRGDRKWVKKWEKTVQTEDEFSVPLVELFMKKVDERCQVAAELAIT